LSRRSWPSRRALPPCCRNYERWLRRFPDFGAHAASDGRRFLRHWEGLGYYSRARGTCTGWRRRSDPVGKAPAERRVGGSPRIGPYTAAVHRPPSPSENRRPLWTATSSASSRG
jgi:hypothetical protein